MGRPRGSFRAVNLLSVRVHDLTASWILQDLETACAEAKALVERIGTEGGREVFTHASLTPRRNQHGTSGHVHV